jgi:hypothetical protein
MSRELLDGPWLPVGIVDDAEDGRASLVSAAGPVVRLLVDPKAAPPPPVEARGASMMDEAEATLVPGREEDTEEAVRPCAAAGMTGEPFAAMVAEEAAADADAAA